MASELINLGIVFNFNYEGNQWGKQNKEADKSSFKICLRFQEKIRLLMFKRQFAFNKKKEGRPLP